VLQVAVEVSCPPLPEDAVLLHVGLHKTGTTAIQTLLAANRPILVEHGVLYPGDRDDHHGLARSLLQRAYGPADDVRLPPRPAVWTDFVAELAQQPGRVVISSEYLSTIEDEDCARLVRDLGPERVHVLIGIRSLAGAAVSMWQQSLKDGRTLTIGGWVERAVGRAGAPAKSPRSLDHGRLGALARQWADAAGPDRVTMAVVEGQDRTWLPTVFEQLLDLPAGLLSAQQPPLANRGMTAAEAEFVRRVNVAAKNEVGYSLHRRFVRFGAIRDMVERRTPPPDEARPALPGWAIDELAAAAAAAAAEIRASGVRILGDLDQLATAPAGSAESEPPGAVPMDAAVEALLGAVRVGIKATNDAQPTRPVNASVRAVPAGVLARELGRRVRRRASSALSRRRRAT